MAETKSGFSILDDANKNNAGMTVTALADTCVPKLTEFSDGNVLILFTIVDGRVAFQLFHKERKRIMDAAIEALSAPKLTNAEERRVRSEAELEGRKYPWWPNTEINIFRMLEKHYRNYSTLVSYIPEVDSWSFIVQKPDHMIQGSLEYCATVAKELAALLLAA